MGSLFGWVIEKRRFGLVMSEWVVVDGVSWAFVNWFYGFLVSMDCNSWQLLRMIHTLHLRPLNNSRQRLCLILRIDPVNLLLQSLRLSLVSPILKSLKPEHCICMRIMSQMLLWRPRGCRPVIAQLVVLMGQMGFVPWADIGKMLRNHQCWSFHD